MSYLVQATLMGVVFFRPVVHPLCRRITYGTVNIGLLVRLEDIDNAYHPFVVTSVPGPVIYRLRDVRNQEFEKYHQCSTNVDPLIASVGPETVCCAQ